MKKIYTFLIMILYSLNVNAGTCTNCTIRNLGFGPYYDNFCSTDTCVFVMVQGDITGKPSCSDQGWQFVLDTSTKSGQHTLSFLLSAYAMKKTITISGNGFCSYWNRAEDFRYGLYGE